MLSAYGRAASTRSCARRSFAAETTFMALVICCVFLTERIRRRISIKLGIVYARSGDHRFLGMLGHEILLELRDRVLQFVLQIVVENFLFAYRREQGRMGILHEFIKLLLERT